MLGYLSHVDTVLADPDDWTHDPWSGERPRRLPVGPRRARHEVARPPPRRSPPRRSRARAGGPPRGELKVISVVDEETGGRLGAQWLTEQRPDARARRLARSTRAAAPVMPYGDRRLYGVCCAEKGTFRFPVRARGGPAHAVGPAARRQRAAQARAGASRGSASASASSTSRAEPRALLEALGEDPSDPQARARARCARSSRGSPRWSSRRCASPPCPRASSPPRRST